MIVGKDIHNRDLDAITNYVPRSVNDAIKNQRSSKSHKYSGAFHSLFIKGVAITLALASLPYVVELFKRGGDAELYGAEGIIPKDAKIQTIDIPTGHTIDKVFFANQDLYSKQVNAAGDTVLSGPFGIKIDVDSEKSLKSAYKHLNLEMEINGMENDSQAEVVRNGSIVYEPLNR
jgi:hypothetical protein